MTASGGVSAAIFRTRVEGETRGGNGEKQRADAAGGETAAFAVSMAIRRDLQVDRRYSSTLVRGGGPFRRRILRFLKWLQPACRAVPKVYARNLHPRRDKGPRRRRRRKCALYRAPLATATYIFLGYRAVNLNESPFRINGRPSVILKYKQFATRWRPLALVTILLTKTIKSHYTRYMTVTFVNGFVIARWTPCRLESFQL